MDGRTPPSLPSAELPAETSAVPPTGPSSEPSTGPPVAPPREWAHYLPASPALRETGLACLGAGEQSGPLPPLAERVLSRHALVLVSSGAGTFTDPAGTHPVTAPAWIWLEPGTPHSYGPDAHGWTEHWVLFEGVGARRARGDLRRAAPRRDRPRAARAAARLLARAPAAGRSARRRRGGSAAHLGDPHRGRHRHGGPLGRPACRAQRGGGRRVPGADPSCDGPDPARVRADHPALAGPGAARPQRSADLAGRRGGGDRRRLLLHPPVHPPHRRRAAHLPP